MHIFIPGNVPSSKNSKQWTGRALISSKATRKWRSNTQEHWINNRLRFQKWSNDKPRPLKIGFKFIRGTRHQFDYPNPLQTVLDEMVRYKWLEDDNADEVMPYFLTYEYDKENPGVIIVCE